MSMSLGLWWLVGIGTYALIALGMARWTFSLGYSDEYMAAKVRYPDAGHDKWDELARGESFIRFATWVGGMLWPVVVCGFVFWIVVVIPLQAVAPYVRKWWMAPANRRVRKAAKT